MSSVWNNNIVVHACETCNKEFRDRRALKKHRVVHDASLKKAECSHCHLKFRCNNMLRRHVASFHGSAQAPPTAHRCEMCDWAGFTKISLKEHQKSHLKCSHEDCNRRFKTFFLAMKHARLHAAADNKCPQCDKKFIYKRILVDHLKRHRAVLKGELRALDREEAPQRRRVPSTPHATKCFNCGQTFNNRWLLNRLLRRDCNYLEIPYVGDFMDDS